MSTFSESHHFWSEKRSPKSGLSSTLHEPMVPARASPKASLALIEEEADGSGNASVDKYLALIGGILVMLSLGALYSFGNMLPYLASYMAYTHTHESERYEGSHKLKNSYNNYSSSLLWIFALSLIGQGSVFPVGGRLEQLIGARKSALIGCVLASFGGVLVSYWTLRSGMLGLLILSYGFLFGAGIGVSYPSILVCGMKWWPRRRGMANGLIVAGFGGGSLIFDTMQTAFINPADVKLDDDYGFTLGGAALIHRIPKVFILQFAILVFMQVIGLLLLREKKDLPTVVEFTTENMETPLNGAMHSHKLKQEHLRLQMSSDSLLISKLVPNAMHQTSASVSSMHTSVNGCETPVGSSSEFESGELFVDIETLEAGMKHEYKDTEEKLTFVEKNEELLLEDSISFEFEERKRTDTVETAVESKKPKTPPPTPATPQLLSSGSESTPLVITVAPSHTLSYSSLVSAMGRRLAVLSDLSSDGNAQGEDQCQSGEAATEQLKVDVSVSTPLGASSCGELGSSGSPEYLRLRDEWDEKTAANVSEINLRKKSKGVTFIDSTVKSPFTVTDSMHFKQRTLTQLRTVVAEANNETVASEAAASGSVAGERLPAEALEFKRLMYSRPFWLLNLSFFCNCVLMVFVSTEWKAFGSGYLHMKDDSKLSLIGAVSAVFNGFGRVFWGLLLDFANRRVAARRNDAADISMRSIHETDNTLDSEWLPTAAKLLPDVSGYILVDASSRNEAAVGRVAVSKAAHRWVLSALLLLWTALTACFGLIRFCAPLRYAAFGAVVSLMFACVGGNFSIFPTTVAHVFGHRNSGLVYGFIFAFASLSTVTSTFSLAFVRLHFGWIWTTAFVSFWGLLSLALTFALPLTSCT